MKQDPTDLTVFEAGRALRSGALSSVELTRVYLARITARNPSITAFVYIGADDALASAQAADLAFANGIDHGPLHGIPFAIKDIFDVAGWPVRWGSRLATDRIATTTAPAVQAMLDAGAIPIGLVATYELATVGPDDTSLYPQPRNPWHPAHVTGHPALSLPVGFCDGLPLGMQIIGRRGDEAGICRVGAAFEAATDHGAGDLYLA